MPRTKTLQEKPSATLHVQNENGNFLKTLPGI